MGVSRRIKFKYKFSRKYETNVYQLFNKKNYVRDIFVFKLFSRLFKGEAYGIEKRLVLHFQQSLVSRHRRTLGLWINNNLYCIICLKLIYKLKYVLCVFLHKATITFFK